MNKLYVLIALPAAGKSTWSQKMVEDNDNIRWISSDSIREEVFGDVNDQTNNGEVFNIMFNRVRDALKEGHDVIYDATNLSRKRRIAFLKNFESFSIEKIAVMFCTTYETCLKRNEERERTVPREAMERMLRSFEAPSKVEGFDEIKYIYNESETLLTDELMKKNEIPHDNPHHTLNCAEHCRAATQYICEHYKEKELFKENLVALLSAARCHDIGKFMTKTWFDAKGNPSDVAHYYNHDNISAYLYLTSSAGKFHQNDTKELTSNLINNHMIFFNKDAIPKRQKLYGKEFWRMLEFLHEADVASH